MQGGGSHGAFTWGVLDHLLQDETLSIDGISGTSAGALNAAVMACGYARGGRSGARAALAAFWHDVSSSGACFGGFQLPSTALNRLWSAPMLAPMLAVAPGITTFNLDANPLYVWFNEFLRAFSPAQFNPLDLNPLRDVLRRHVQDDALRGGPLSLFITATAVRTGQPRVFSAADLSVDALLASACLPQLFRPVVIDGEPYWDGGYSGNPALWPLIYNTDALDVVLVQINPLVRSATPGTAMEIADRVNEITFNAGLVSEMRAISFVQKLLADGAVDGGQYKGLRLHRIDDEEGLAPLHPSSKLNTDWPFLEALFALGQAAAKRWLAAHRADIGQRATLDVQAQFLAPRRA